MGIDKVSVRNEYAEDLCQALNDKCLEQDNFKNYSFIKTDEYDFDLPENENPFVYLVYDDSEQLIAYLGFIKIDKNNMQVCMAVDPDSRRQRIGTNLFLRLVSEFDSCSYQVSLDPNNNIGKEFLQKLGFEFASTENSMCLSKDDFKFDAEPIELKIENDEENDLLKITGTIDEEIEESEEPIKKEIGWLFLARDDSSFSLFDIEVNEDYREKGYGNRILQTALRDAFKYVDKVLLHVSSNNTPAINLYEKNGFKILETIDLYEL